MLIRKAAFMASVFSGLFGVTQADAACFGKRRCCQSTPVVCPPCSSPVVVSSSVMYQSAPGVIGSPCYDPCGRVIGEVVTQQKRYEYSAGDPIEVIEASVRNIEADMLKIKARLGIQN